MLRQTLIAATALFATPVHAEEVPSWVKDIVSKAVSEELKDPQSAQFRWLPYRQGNVHYCGLVNARNSYGGYAGFQPFLVVIPTEPRAGAVAVVFGIANDLPRDIDSRVVRKTCAEQGFDLSGPYAE